MSDCKECGTEDIGGTHACKTMDIAAHMYNKLNAKYGAAISLLEMISDESNQGYDWHEEARELLKELDNE